MKCFRFPLKSWTIPIQIREMVSFCTYFFLKNNLYIFLHRVKFRSDIGSAFKIRGCVKHVFVYKQISLKISVNLREISVMLEIEEKSSVKNQKLWACDRVPKFGWKNVCGQAWISHLPFWRHVWYRISFTR